MAFVISFFAKALASTGYFCYDSLTSASIVMILPGSCSSSAFQGFRKCLLVHLPTGYIILTGALEIAVRSDLGPSSLLDVLD